MKKKKRLLLVGFIILLCMVVAVSVVGIVMLTKNTTTLQGQIESTEVRMSGLLPGHVEEIYVHEGDSVHWGDTLLRISSPAVEAEYRSALALQEVAVYQNKKVDAGTRIEVVTSAKLLWNKSKADLNLAKKTFQRISNLYKDSVVTQQRFDEAKALYKSAQDAERIAYQQYKMAREGARSEDRESAGAMVDASTQAAEAINALLNETVITAPCDGQILSIYPHIGELVGVGTPLASIILLSEAHVVINVREDMLHHFPMGKVFKAKVPGVARSDIKFKVYYINPLGSYATWQSTKQSGSYDMKTFQIKARPEKPVQGLRPGMSVLVKVHK